MSIDEQRERMVSEQLAARGIVDPRVLAACLRVPRHVFVPEAAQDQAYADHPVSIGGGQTISQPFMVALMTQSLRLQGHERVLEVGTGSGYQLAILSELALEAYSVERLPELASLAAARLERLGCLNAHVNVSDGWAGWPAVAPYDGIVVTAAADRIPEALIAQLGEGGRLVMPVGSRDAQTLLRVEKRGGRLQTEQLTSCVFVPLVGGEGA